MFHQLFDILSPGNCSVFSLQSDPLDLCVCDAACIEHSSTRLGNASTRLGFRVLSFKFVFFDRCTTGTQQGIGTHDSTDPNTTYNSNSIQQTPAQCMTTLHNTQRNETFHILTRYKSRTQPSRTQHIISYNITSRHGATLVYDRTTPDNTKPNIPIQKNSTTQNRTS